MTSVDEGNEKYETFGRQEFHFGALLSFSSLAMMSSTLMMMSD